MLEGDVKFLASVYLVIIEQKKKEMIRVKVEAPTLNTIRAAGRLQVVKIIKLKLEIIHKLKLGLKRTV